LDFRKWPDAVDVGSFEMPARLQRAVRAVLLVAVLGFVARPTENAAFARKPRGFGGAPSPGLSRPGRSHDVEVVDAVLKPKEEPDRTPEIDEVIIGDTGPSIGDLTSPLQTVIVGGGAAGLWLALLLASTLRDRVRVRVYEPRWEHSDTGQFHWSAAAQESPHRTQVATIQGDVWSELPNDVQELVFSQDAFVEQWPSSNTGRNDVVDVAGSTFPRNLPVGSLEDALLSAVQLPMYAEAIELSASTYDMAEHSRLGKEDRFHAFVAADGEAARRASDGIVGAGFGRVMPGPGSRSCADSLAITFDLGQSHASAADAAPLSIAAGTVVSRAQRRYLVSWTNRSRGTLHMRLTVAEAKQLAEAVIGDAEKEPSTSTEVKGLPWLHASAEQLWSRVLDGLKLYGIPEEAACQVAHHSFDGIMRPSFFATVANMYSPASVPPLAFLVGDAAEVSSAHFGPGFGLGAALEGVQSLVQTLAGEKQGGSWWQGKWLAPLVFADHAAKMALLRDRGRQSSSVGIEQCIDIGLAKTDSTDHVGAAHPDRDIFLENLRYAIERLSSEELPPERVAELPAWEALHRHMLATTLAPETFSVMASTGPWLTETTNGKAERCTPEAGEGPGVYNMGGPTPQGLVQAKQLTKAAQAGDSEAQFQLGVMYFTANGVYKDGPAALNWLVKSAEGGHRQAQNCVGSILRNGVDSLPMDKKQALRWFQRAAEQGELEAQYNLGEMYEEADGVENDDEKAFKWYQAAAEGGLALAQLKAGIMLHAGNGVDKDIARAVPWITRAAEQGIPQALHILGSLHYVGDGVLFDKVAAAKYFKQAAEAGHAVSQYCIGVMLELGDGIAPDLAEAQHWLQKAAAQGLIEAQARCREQTLLPQPKEA